MATATQLGLVLELSPAPTGAVLPNVNGVKIPFEWVSVEHLLNIDSVDFDEGLRTERNRRQKRDDWHYPGLVESIREDGFHDPVFLHRYDGLPDELGNGHHRVLAALDLGYTHVPVTSNHRYQWETSVDQRDYAADS